MKGWCLIDVDERLIFDWQLLKFWWYKIDKRLIFFDIWKKCWFFIYDPSEGRAPTYAGKLAQSTHKWSPNLLPVPPSLNNFGLCPQRCLRWRPSRQLRVSRYSRSSRCSSPSPGTTTVGNKSRYAPHSGCHRENGQLGLIESQLFNFVLLTELSWELLWQKQIISWAMYSDV